MDVILGAEVDVIFQYEFCFANYLQSQLLISHDCYSSNKCRQEITKGEIKPFLGNILTVLRLIDQFLFQSGSLCRTVDPASG
jgi:hypothetical protein